MEQRRGELPDGEPQQEPADEPHEQQRLPPGSEFRWLPIVMDVTGLSFQTEQIIFQSDRIDDSIGENETEAA